MLFGLALIGTLGCDVIPDAGKTFQPGTEALLAPGYFHVEGEPKRADQRIVVRNFGQDGVESAVSDTFEPGQEVIVDGAAHPGPRGLTVNGVKCAGTFTIMGDQETDVTLRVSSETCESTTVRVHGPNQPH